MTGEAAARADLPPPIGDAELGSEFQDTADHLRDFRAMLWCTAVGDHADQEPDRRSVAVLERIGAHRAQLWARQTTNPNDVRKDKLGGRCLAVADRSSPQREAVLDEAWAVLNRECPPFERPADLWQWYGKQKRPHSYRAIPGRGTRCYEEALRVYNGLYAFGGKDVVFVPFVYDSSQNRSQDMLFYTDHVVEDFTPFELAAPFLLGAMSRARPLPGKDPEDASMFSDKAMEIFRWAIQGKTVSEISAITGLGAKCIRYQLYRARRLLGYATVTQALIDIAKTYDLSP